MMATTRKYLERPDRGDLQDKHVGALNELRATVWLLNQGYDVFRNVSASGLVDVVAMKDGKLHKFDVKAQKTAGLSADQLAIGVRVLWVLPDGTCGIADRSPEHGRNTHVAHRPLETMRGLH